MRHDGDQDQSMSSRKGEIGSHSRHIWKVEFVRPADGMGVGMREEEDSGVWDMRKEKDRVSIYRVGEDGRGKFRRLCLWTS